jgi:RNA polymerase sigma-70 factor (ECF subfamily)
MEDSAIIDLYWQRADSAISETDKKYGKYCHSIAYNLLENTLDAEECVNDTWLSAWNAMPDNRPKILSAFLGAITRNHAISMFRARSSQKRGNGQMLLALDELSECVPDAMDVEGAVEAQELKAAIGRFVAALPENERDIFVARYWYLAPLKDIAKRQSCTEGKIKSSLHRTRSKLLNYLQEEKLC